MERYFIIYSEDWETQKRCQTLKEAEAWKYQKYGYAGHIIEYRDGKEVAEHN